MKDRNKRKLIIYVLVGVLMLTTVAYAALSTVLNVSGTVVKKGNLWNIYFTNPSSASIVGTATGSNINIQASSLNFQVSLYKPGDKVTYTVDIKNGGTIDAILNSISLTGLDTAKSNSLNYTVTYSNGSTIKEGDTLNIGASRTIKITVEFDSSATSIPESDVNLTFGVTLIYGQTTSSSSTGTSGITSNNVIAGIYGESIQNGTPTPTSPIEIKSVGEKTKNLFDIDKMMEYSSNVVKEGNSYTFSLKSAMFSTGLNSNLKKDDIITVSGKVLNISGTNFRVNVVYKNRNSVTISQYSGTDLNTEVDLTKTTKMTDDVDYIRFDYTTTGIIKLTDFQIEQSETATSYEPYGYKVPITVSNGSDTKTTNIYLKEPLRKVGEYADYLDLTNKKVVRNVKEIEILTLNRNDAAVDGHLYYKKVNNLKTGSVVLSNYFKYNAKLSNEFGVLSNQFGVLYFSGKNIVEKDNSELSDSSLMNTWLTEKSNSGNPVLVDYILETPTEESVDIPSIPSLTGNVTYSIGTRTKPSKIEYGY